jgi:hypothetical protein
VKYFHLKLFSLLFFCVPVLFPQTDWEKWGKADISYKMQDPYTEREYSFDGNPGEFMLKTFVAGTGFVSELTAITHTGLHARVFHPVGKENKYISEI